MSLLFYSEKSKEKLVKYAYLVISIGSVAQKKDSIDLFSVKKREKFLENREKAIFFLTSCVCRGIVDGRCNSLFFMPKFSLRQKSLKLIGSYESSGQAA